MRVTVNVYTTLREKLGWKSRVVEVRDGATLGELLDSLPDLKKVLDENQRKGWTPMILVNGVHADMLEGLKTRLKDGDVVDVFPAAGGG